MLIRSLLGGPILLTPTEGGHLMAELRGNVGGFVGLRADQDDLTFVFRTELPRFDLAIPDSDDAGQQVTRLVEFKNPSGHADGGSNGTKKFAANREQLAAAMSKLMLVAGVRYQRYLHLIEGRIPRVP